jgi:hypothetical protein
MTNAMPRFRYVPKPQNQSPFQTFASAEDAWFWSHRARQARRDGVRFEDGPGSWQRPCDPDDIVRELARLYRRGAIGPLHIATLARFAALERAPDGRREDECAFVAPWDEALDRLAVSLKAKGIVA